MEKLLKLYTTNTYSNMHLFDSEEKLKKYEKVSDIIDEFMITREETYKKRKEFQINNYKKELVILSNKARYIMEVLNDTIDLRKKKKEVIIKMLEDKGYDKLENDKDYKYLVKMPMDSVSEENVSKLLKEKGEKENILVELQNTTVGTIWINELTALKNEYMKYIKRREKKQRR